MTCNIFAPTVRRSVFGIGTQGTGSKLEIVTMDGEFQIAVNSLIYAYISFYYSNRQTEINVCDTIAVINQTPAESLEDASSTDLGDLTNQNLNSATNIPEQGLSFTNLGPIAYMGNILEHPEVLWTGLITAVILLHSKYVFLP